MAVPCCQIPSTPLQCPARACITPALLCLPSASARPWTQCSPRRPADLQLNCSVWARPPTHLATPPPSACPPRPPQPPPSLPQSGWQNPIAAAHRSMRWASEDRPELTLHAPLTGWRLRPITRRLSISSCRPRECRHTLRFHPPKDWCTRLSSTRYPTISTPPPLYRDQGALLVSNNSWPAFDSPTGI